MKHLINTFIFMFFSMGIVSAQFGVSAKIGYGHYNLDDLKEYQEALNTYFLKTYNVQLSQLENFPDNMYYSFEVFVQSKKDFRFNLGYSHFTTGSRIYYEDYSGILKNDIITSSNTYNIIISQVLLKTFVKIGLYMNPQIISNKTDISLGIKLSPDYINEEKLKNKSVNSGLGCGVFLRKPIKYFEISFETGYYFDLKRNDLSYKEYSGDKYLYIPNGYKRVHNDWSGYRMALGVGYNF
jgi:hypothetical protein